MGPLGFAEYSDRTTTATYTQVINGTDTDVTYGNVSWGEPIWTVIVYTPPMSRNERRWRCEAGWMEKEIQLRPAVMIPVRVQPRGRESGIGCRNFRKL